VPDSIAEFRTVGAVPGVDGIESLELRNTGVRKNTNQLEPGIDDGARSIGKLN
jgi:hypothetical protein